MPLVPPSEWTPPVALPTYHHLPPHARGIRDELLCRAHFLGIGEQITLHKLYRYSPKF